MSQRINNPKVSVIITTCNRSGLVQRAIQSVLEQDYSNYDLHIVDDASNDDTREVLGSIVKGNDKMFYWRHDERRGLSAARNTGLTRSDGEYIAFLDDDDIWMPGSLKKRIDRLNQLSPQQMDTLGVIHGGYDIHIVDENRVVYVDQKISGEIKECACRRKMTTMSGTELFPRIVLDKVGWYDEDLCSSVDHDIMMKLAVHGYHAITIHEPLAILYLYNRKKSMITETRQRIKGVEHFLEKWAPTYIEWHGDVGAFRFIRRYRTEVLGDLSAKKLAEGDFVAAWQLAKHVVGSNGCSLVETWRLSIFFVRHFLRKFVPKSLIIWMKEGQKRGDG